MWRSQSGRIVAVGRVEGAARRTLDADGLLVTPGFVDVHTHYDGQATWDPLLTPSCWHGVTTAVMGNCGVGFAPMKSERRQFLIELMEGVEDIPGAVLAEGVDWGWESFPEYLDALEAKPRIMDLGAQLPHAALRYYVMGERGAAREPANAEDLQRMAELTEQALTAGALGFTTSRTLLHKTARGQYVPNFGAAARELNAIAAGVKRAGRGVLQLLSDFDDLEAEFELLCDWVKASGGRPLSFTLVQRLEVPQQWQRLLELIDDAQRRGLPIRGQVAPARDRPGARAAGDAAPVHDQAELSRHRRSCLSPSVWRACAIRRCAHGFSPSRSTLFPAASPISSSTCWRGSIASSRSAIRPTTSRRRRRASRRALRAWAAIRWS